MKFICNVSPNAVPCVGIKTHDDAGKLLDRPIKRTKVVKKGGSVGWVDRCSRKHFIAVDDEAKALNAKDFKKMKLELKELNVKLPADVSFAECADSLAAIHAKKSDSLSNAKRRIFQPEEEQDLTNRQLKEKLDEAGVEYQPNANKAKLKELVAGIETEEGEE